MRPAAHGGAGLPRPLEAVIALAALACLTPLLLVIALLVRATSPGPALFCQVRVGRSGRPFTLLKFRSMRQTCGGPEVTCAGDARVTRIGRLLRKSKLDELPQLWNVVRGDLALVGPRPEVPRYVDLADPLWQKVLRHRPGITDPVTIQLRNEEEVLARCAGDPEQYYVDTLLRMKLMGYAAYLDRRDWLSDLRVLAHSLGAVIRPSRSVGRGASPPGRPEWPAGAGDAAGKREASVR
ncbi:MAG: sugar transferase [Thermodesulfobacteriota bacterium]